jgi:hypothetical protein
MANNDSALSQFRAASIELLQQSSTRLTART